MSTTAKIVPSALTVASVYAQQPMSGRLATASTYTAVTGAVLNGADSIRTAVSDPSQRRAATVNVIGLLTTIAGTVVMQKAGQDTDNLARLREFTTIGMGLLAAGSVLSVTHPTTQPSFLPLTSSPVAITGNLNSVPNSVGHLPASAFPMTALGAGPAAVTTALPATASASALATPGAGTSRSAGAGSGTAVQPAAPPAAGVNRSRRRGQ